MVRNSLVGSISQLDQETLKHSGRTEWPPLLHNLAMLHAAVRLRALYGMYGWNYPATMDFSFSEIHVSSINLLHHWREGGREPMLGYENKSSNFMGAFAKASLVVNSPIKDGGCCVSHIFRVLFNIVCRPSPNERAVVRMGYSPFAQGQLRGTTEMYDKV